MTSIPPASPDEAAQGICGRADLLYLLSASARIGLEAESLAAFLGFYPRLESPQKSDDAVVAEFLSETPRIPGPTGVRKPPRIHRDTSRGDARFWQAVDFQVLDGDQSEPEPSTPVLASKPIAWRAKDKLVARTLFSSRAGRVGKGPGIAFLAGGGVTWQGRYRTGPRSCVDYHPARRRFDFFPGILAAR